MPFDSKNLHFEGCAQHFHVSLSQENVQNTKQTKSLQYKFTLECSRRELSFGRSSVRVSPGASVFGILF